ncbi:MAG: hypothetical protein B6D61_07930 [Bacteroidetes bacterium 4484_249]|nr:MAG: hypothetical protein B6D61_07930 [Bacteroidetes bacterium 4484_249]
MKFLFIICAISFSTIFAQNTENREIRKKHKSINEINYQIPLSLGYNHIHNFNDKFLLGTGLHLGLCVYLKGYIDLLQFKIFTRNAFNKDKFNKKIDYDIGLFFSYPYFEIEVDPTYGFILLTYYNFWKMKIGIDLLITAINDNGKVEKSPEILLTPILVYKF